MCNKLHPDYSEIPATGIAYKLVSPISRALEYHLHYRKADSKATAGKLAKKHRVKQQRPYWRLSSVINQQFCSLVDYYHYYHTGDNWIKWESDDNNHGFCMFRSREKAEQALSNWHRMFPMDRGAFIIEVEYSKGLGEHPEDGFISGEVYTIMIAKEFRQKEQITDASTSPKQ